MRKMQILLVLFISLFVSCSKQSDDINQPIDKDKNHFQGEWSVTEVHGGFYAPEQFTKEEVIFKFMENDSVNINLNVELSSSSRLLFKNDTILQYSYDSIEMKIGDLKFEYIISDTLLKLIDNLASDGIMIELEK